MSEQLLKHPALNDRRLDTVEFDALVTVGDICCCTTNTIDIPGLTIAAATATTVTLSGFECLADVALDSGRRAGLTIKATGTVGGASDAEVGSLTVVSGIISGTAGSRIITYTFDSAADAFTFATDTLTNAVFGFSLPVKNKDF